MKSKKNKKAIWLFAGGDMQEIAAKKIKEMGYGLILTDMDKNCACRKYADEFVCLNTFDIKGNLKAAQNLQKKYDIKGTFTCGTDCHEVAAKTADFLKIHGVDPKISENCRYKFKTREILSKAGLYQPKFEKVKNFEQALTAVKKIGLPAVLKATDNSGSRGFVEIKKMEDLTKEAFQRARDASVTGTGFVLVEERLEPVENEIAEQSLETVWYNGKMHWLNWVDRIFRKDLLLFKKVKTDLYSNIPWGVEIGHINPALHSKETSDKVQKMIKKAGEAIGLDKQKGGHIMKADIMLTKKGPCIIELTLRLSGGWDSSFTTIERGADFTGGALRMALGQKATRRFFKKYFKYKRSGIFSSMLAKIPEDPKDCIGRKFAHGKDKDRQESLVKAYKNLKAQRYISKGNPNVDNRIKNK